MSVGLFSLYCVQWLALLWINPPEYWCWLEDSLKVSASILLLILRTLIVNNNRATNSFSFYHPFYPFFNYTLSTKGNLCMRLQTLWHSRTIMYINQQYFMSVKLLIVILRDFITKNSSNINTHLWVWISSFPISLRYICIKITILDDAVTFEVYLLT